MIIDSNFDKMNLFDIVHDKGIKPCRNCGKSNYFFHESFYNGHIASPDYPLHIPCYRITCRKCYGKKGSPMPSDVGSVELAIDKWNGDKLLAINPEMVGEPFSVRLGEDFNFKKDFKKNWWQYLIALFIASIIIAFIAYIKLRGIVN